MPTWASSLLVCNAWHNLRCRAHRRDLKIKSLSQIAIVVAILGGVGVFVSIVGFLTQTSRDLTQTRKLALTAYNCCIIFLHVLFTVAIFASFLTKPTIRLFLAMNKTEIQKWIPQFSDDEYINLDKNINTITNYMNVIGFFCIAVSILLLIT
ncbi:MAG: hypothetical protein EZS28_036716, partial [Streblomastix strix]